ncbi:hypothetical protein [Nostoc parmelioides]|uniref:Glycosyltransferase RgtA/B/C/D-like domain-containing protein n=1 Tax=Nostoc parmelioides FACHB-3921 TaxID=2692909 RepID=A0ABR8BBR8_9NOSO|nr:hypothetical protein [Nostoc parmelioides]MBD2251220.1 hypothetical protein [Nostoc parmelioides FACHB-3921]
MFYSSSNKKINILVIFLCFYIFLAFLPLPSGIKVGLDPSWQYAISRAAVDKLVFGKDIIFTYGPFGYLIHGAVLKENFYGIFLFRLMVELITFVISIATINLQKTKFNKILLSISIFFTYLIGSSIDYKIIFALIMVLSWDNIINQKNIRWWALVIGAISGFCLLTKFNIGVCTLGIIVFVIIGRISWDFQHKAELSTNIFALSDSIIAALTSAFLLLNTSDINHLKQFIFCIFFASFSGIFFDFIKKYLLKDNNSVNPNIIHRKIYPKINFKNGFYIAYILAILVTNFYFSPQLINFLKGSLEISSGYSSAMSIVGSPWELGFAIVGVFVLLLTLIQLIHGEFLGLGLALGFTLWMSFKHGYVRQDGHVYLFIQCWPIISSIAITKLSDHSKIVKNVTLFYLISLISIYSLTASPFGNADANLSSKLINNFNPINVINQVSMILNPEKLFSQINESSNLELSKVKLPEIVLQTLNDATVDIFPWEISIVESNKLNWLPRPIFQSYSAYTKFLDNANLHSISRKSPENIIYDFLSIDNRHPFFDEPATFSYVVCNYKLSSKVQQFINTPALSNLIFLQKRENNICTPSLNHKLSLVDWNQSVKLMENPSLVRASIKFEYSLLGKIYKTLFRIPPVTIDIELKNGSHPFFRIIPENSENGVIVSPLPINDNQIFSLFDGKWNQQVKSFKFSTSNPILYKPKIQVRLDNYGILDSSISIKDEFIDISKLKDILFLQKPTEEHIGSVDYQNIKSVKAQAIDINGWMISKSNPQKPLWIFVTQGAANIPVAITKTGLHRYDVAEFYKNQSYNQSGWSLSLRADDILKDSYFIKFWIYEPENKTAKPIIGNHILKIKKGT